jgi:hypothetical protein
MTMLGTNDRDGIRVRTQREIARISFMRIRAISSHPAKTTTSEQERQELRSLTERSKKQSEPDRNHLSDGSLGRRIKALQEEEASAISRWLGVINSEESTEESSDTTLDHEWGELIVDMAAAESIGTK